MIIPSFRNSIRRSKHHHLIVHLNGDSLRRLFVPAGPQTEPRICAGDEHRNPYKWCISRQCFIAHKLRVMAPHRKGISLIWTGSAKGGIGFARSWYVISHCKHSGPFAAIRFLPLPNSLLLLHKEYNQDCQRFARRQPE
jgi:hypothetical protein